MRYAPEADTFVKLKARHCCPLLSVVGRAGSFGVEHSTQMHRTRLRHLPHRSQQIDVVTEQAFQRLGMSKGERNAIWG
jgi:hypothetical protein